MNMLYALLIIVVGIVCSIGLYVYFHYKEKELEFQKVCGKQNEEISIKALELEIEKENTKQMELDSTAFRARHDVAKEQEKTKQLQIKSDYKNKHNENLYS